MNRGYFLSKVCLKRQTSASGSMLVSQLEYGSNADPPLYLVVERFFDGSTSLYLHSNNCGSESSCSHDSRLSKASLLWGKQ